MARPLRALLWTVVAAAGLIALILFGLAAHGSPAGRSAPALPRERLAGPPATLSSLLAAARGGPGLVVFWASWCGPCAQEAPALERFARSPAGRGRIIGVDWSDGRAGAQAFIRRYAWTFPNLRDAEGTVGNDYRLTSLPTTFVIAAGPSIRGVLHGPQDEQSLTEALARVARSRAS